MTFRIADTFTAALARLAAAEQKAAKTAAFDLQMNPAAARRARPPRDPARAPELRSAPPPPP
ncbi:MAG: hypothetical protein VX463_14705, partial [Pseudomonadota bacterium]|nr:hypothetical protein [Pseudomonadota bacterium]